MNEMSATTRDRIEAQGFLGLDDRTVSRINYWLRLSSAICSPSFIYGLVFGKPSSCGTKDPDRRGL